MSLEQLHKKRLDAIQDAAVKLVEDYPADPMDVAHVLLSLTVEIMAADGLDRHEMLELMRVVIADG